MAAGWLRCTGSFILEAHLPVRVCCGNLPSSVENCKQSCPTKAHMSWDRGRDYYSEDLKGGIPCLEDSATKFYGRDNRKERRDSKGMESKECSFWGSKPWYYYTAENHNQDTFWNMQGAESRAFTTSSSNLPLHLTRKIHSIDPSSPNRNYRTNTNQILKNYYYIYKNPFKLWEPQVPSSSEDYANFCRPSLCRWVGALPSLPQHMFSPSLV